MLTHICIERPEDRDHLEYQGVDLGEWCFGNGLVSCGSDYGIVEGFVRLL
jgi:hypothetical protein